MVKLFVGGFPLDIEEIELVKLFAVHGDVSTIKIVRNKQTKVCKGYAFIEMEERKDAEKAADALNGMIMDGKPLTVNINEEQVTDLRPLMATKAFTAHVAGKINDEPWVAEKKKRPRRVI